MNSLPVTWWSYITHDFPWSYTSVNFLPLNTPEGKVSFLYNSRSKGLLLFRQMCLPKLLRTVSEFCGLRPNPLCLLSAHPFHSLSSDPSLWTTQPRSTFPDLFWPNKESESTLFEGPQWPDNRYSGITVLAQSRERVGWVEVGQGRAEPLPVHAQPQLGEGCRRGSLGRLPSGSGLASLCHSHVASTSLACLHSQFWTLAPPTRCLQKREEAPPRAYYKVLPAPHFPHWPGDNSYVFPPPKIKWKKKFIGLACSQNTASCILYRSLFPTQLFPAAL